MLKKFFILAVFAAAAAIFPVAAHAAQTTLSLQPGNVYEFTGTDARVVSHVNVSGAGRYEIVLRDAEGEVTRFGRVSGRFSVSGTGAAEITPLAPINVTFDSTRLRVTERRGSALREFELSPLAESLRLENTTGDPLQVRLSGAVSFVIFNRAGDVTTFVNADPDEPLTLITIPARGAALLEPASDRPSVYLPARWYDEEILAETLEGYALERIHLTENEPQTITTEEGFTLRLTGTDAGSPISYEYIVRGRDGHVDRYGEAEGTELTIAAQQSVTITPLENGQIYFPNAWLEDLEIENGSAAPVHVFLYPSDSIRIENTDPLRTHTILIRCAEDTGDEFGFEYVLHYDDDVSFNVNDDFLSPQATVSIPAGGVLTLTATQAAENLAIRVPDVPAITTRNVTVAPLVRHALVEGESVYISNEGDDAKILIQSDESVDFVIYDEDGAILDFGRVEEYILIEENHSALLTAPDDEATLIFLREPDLTLEASEEIALVRQVFEYGEVLQINNNDRRFNRSILIHNESERDAGYDFVLFDAQNNILNYGVSETGLHVIPHMRRITIAPQTGATLSVAFPAEHARVLRIREATAQPLHRVTIAPARTLSFHNRSENDIELSNNSRVGGAGFHLPGEGEYLRHYNPVTGEYFYVFLPPPPIDVENDEPEHGSIVIPANSRITVTAALGEELEIWMPRALARQLGLRV